MKVSVLDTCVGCGVCVNEAGEVFEIKDGKSVVKSGADLESNEEQVRRAAEICPVSAIQIED